MTESGYDAVLAQRREQLQASLVTVRARLDAAMAAAGRDDEVTLVAVTKFHPATDALLLTELGVTELGESRDQEAALKAEALAQLTTAPVRWHFVGQLQTNKAASVARYADLVHSVDRASLAGALARGVARAGRDPLPVLIQVSLDDAADRGGVAPDDVAALAETVADNRELRLAGVMAVAPLGGEPEAAFARLAEVAASLRADHPQATAVSAGMSSDLEQAIAHGATHVRIGTALLGQRDRPIR